MTDAFTRAESGGFVFARPGTPLNPAQADSLLQHLSNELEASRVAVEVARTRLAECQAAHKKAENEFFLSPDCPKVGRGLGMVTAAERDAWVFSKVIEKWEAVHFAELHLANATGYMWKLREQNSLAQSLNNNAQAAYHSYRGGGR